MSLATAIEVVWADVRYAGRALRRSPGFTVVAVLSLALGVGANTAIFQILDAVRLRSLPVRNPHELAEVRIAGGNAGMGLNSGPYGQLTRPIWEELRDHQQAFSGAFAWSQGGVRVGPMSDLRRAKGLRVSGAFFDVLGVQPWRGRLLQPEDEAMACPTSRAVVSYAYWQREMGGRELGRETRLIVDGDPVDVIGVTPPGFFGLAVGDTFDVAGAFCRPKEMRRDVFDVTVMGRLKPGWTIERASAHLDSLSAGVLAATEITGYNADVVERYKRFRLGAYTASAGVSALRQQYDSSLWLLLAITGLVLLIACANLANLMLARASARGREIAVRVALGASRGRLMGQLLTESAVLALAGAVLGIALAQVLSRVLVSSLAADTGSVHLLVETDWRVLLFTTAVAAATCLIFGVTPAWRASGLPPEAALRVAGRGLTAARERLSLQRLMVVAQIAVSLVLVVGALLFVRSFRNLMTFDPGLRQEGITVAFLEWPTSNLPAGQGDEFRAQLLDEVRALPGVVAAATTTNVPLLGNSWTHGVTVGSTVNSAKFTWVSPGYFETMGLRLRQGRDLERHDTRTSPRVAVVNQAFVRDFLGGADPIGKTLRTGEEPNYPSTVYEIVGVVTDSRYSDIRGGIPPQVFAPAPQHPPNSKWATIVVSAEGPSAPVVAAIKRQLAARHPDVAAELLGFKEEVQGQMVRDKLMAMLSGFFGLLAVLLATVGLYGVIAYLATSRRGEIGIRLALGAQRAQVISLIMREAGRLLVLGTAVGTLLALAATRGAASLLFGLQPRDPLVFATAALVLAATTGAAALLPALRAARVDPMVALRLE
jgi:predicted permease